MTSPKSPLPAVPPAPAVRPQVQRPVACTPLEQALRGQQRSPEEGRSSCSSGSQGSGRQHGRGPCPHQQTEGKGREGGGSSSRSRGQGRQGRPVRQAGGSCCRGPQACRVPGPHGTQVSGDSCCTGATKAMQACWRASGWLPHSSGMLTAPQRGVLMVQLVAPRVAGRGPSSGATTSWPLCRRWRTSWWEGLASRLHACAGLCVAKGC